MVNSFTGGSDPTTCEAEVSSAVVEICGFTKLVKLTSVVTVAMVSRGNCSCVANQVTAGGDAMHSITDAGATYSITGGALVTADAGVTYPILGGATQSIRAGAP